MKSYRAPTIREPVSLIVAVEEAGDSAEALVLITARVGERRSQFSTHLLKRHALNDYSAGTAKRCEE